MISFFFTLPSGRVGPKGRRGGALAGRYASVSLGNRGLTPANAQRLMLQDSARSLGDDHQPECLSIRFVETVG